MFTLLANMSEFCYYINSDRMPLFTGSYGDFQCPCVKPTPIGVKKHINQEDWHLHWTYENARSRDPHKHLFDQPFENPYHEYTHSLRWKRKRAVVLIMSERRCYDCGGQATDVHHLTYARLGNEELDDLVPLCHECHAERHGGWIAIAMTKLCNHLAQGKAF